jgi:flavin reductase (DIM6/NTAB) family NADH-FMN oxidoreductase RutF
MKIITPGEIPVKDMHQFLIGSVAPRPIAFVSTIDEQGKLNLAPYSFFNAFSSNPPILVFSSNRRVRDNSTKDTLHNVEKTRECVINVVSYPIVRQMAVASIQFPAGISEFDKTGLTPVPSDLVKPFRIKESPVHMECRVKEIITLGTHGGAGHLVINEVLRMHIDESIIDANNRIDPHKIDLMGRLGRAHYVRASGKAIHTIVQPVVPVSIGYDGLPESVRKSPVLTGNHLGILAGMSSLPSDKQINAIRISDKRVQEALVSNEPQRLLHHLAIEAINSADKQLATAILLIADELTH